MGVATRKYCVRVKLLSVLKTHTRFGIENSDLQPDRRLISCLGYTSIFALEFTYS